MDTCVCYGLHDYECGKNSADKVNYCMETQGGGACFAWCSSSSMCSKFTGTVCLTNIASKDGVQVGVCSTP